MPAVAGAVVQAARRTGPAARCTAPLLAEIERGLPRITAARSGESASRADFLAAEEPLGIRVGGTALTMTMRTPGDDIELAAGFLVSESVVRSPGDITGIKLCDGTSCGHGDHDGLGNIVDVTSRLGANPEVSSLGTTR
jgi:FdhD protein